MFEKNNNSINESQQGWFESPTTTNMEWTSQKTTCSQSHFRLSRVLFDWFSSISNFGLLSRKRSLELVCSLSATLRYLHNEFNRKTRAARWSTKALCGNSETTRLARQKQIMGERPTADRSSPHYCEGLGVLGLLRIFEEPVLQLLRGRRPRVLWGDWWREYQRRAGEMFRGLRGTWGRAKQGEKRHRNLTPQSRVLRRILRWFVEGEDQPRRRHHIQEVNDLRSQEGDGKWRRLAWEFRTCQRSGCWSSPLRRVRLEGTGGWTGGTRCASSPGRGNPERPWTREFSGAAQRALAETPSSTCDRNGRTGSVNLQFVATTQGAIAWVHCARVSQTGKLVRITSI